MGALLRYQAAILLRSHRWILPVLTYTLLTVAGEASVTPLRSGLGWSAAMLLPAVALLTRSMLTAEPDPVRACAAAASGPARAQLATLLVALGGGVVLALSGATFEVLSDESVAGHPLPSITNRIAGTFAHPGVLAAGLGTALICLLVGAAAGALCNPPLLRHPASALLATAAAVVIALAAGVSPANAALRGESAGPHVSPWPSAAAFIAAAVLLAVTWTASVVAATRRAAAP
jgi:hypothetical protein